MQDKKAKKSEAKNVENPKPIRLSSAFTRQVGNIRLEVYNTNQIPDLPKKAYATKWVVAKIVGNRKPAIVYNNDNKTPAIKFLRDLEIELKAKNQ